MGTGLSKEFFTYNYSGGLTIQLDKTKKIVDLGCGPNKVPGAVGVDVHKFDDVDVVCDLNKYPWPLNDNEYDVIWSNQFIEHVTDVKVFLREIHRIGKNGAEVHITTPHFSSSLSWGDFTHFRHLGTKWHCNVTKKKTYMFTSMPHFDLIDNRIIFQNPWRLRNMLTRMIIALDGLSDWERRWCFLFRGENLYTTLRIVK